MVASQRHIDGDDDPPDSLASFLGTDLAGWTDGAYVAAGLKAFAEWDDISTYDMKRRISSNYNETSGWWIWRAWFG